MQRKGEKSVQPGKEEKMVQLTAADKRAKLLHESLSGWVSIHHEITKDSSVRDCFD